LDLEQLALNLVMLEARSDMTLLDAESTLASLAAPRTGEEQSHG
jgi:hypothetical protein